MDDKTPSIAHLCSFVDEMINIAKENTDLKERINALANLMNTEDNKYDKGIILWLRFCIMNLIRRYAFVKDFKINSTSLSNMLVQDYDEYHNDLEAILEKELMILGKDARDWMINSIPSVLGMKLMVVYANMQSQSTRIEPRSPNTGTVGEESFFRKVLKDQTFYVLLKPGHYDALYSYEDISNFKCLDYYDPDRK